MEPAVHHAIAGQGRAQRRSCGDCSGPATVQVVNEVCMNPIGARPVYWLCAQCARLHVEHWAIASYRATPER